MSVQEVREWISKNKLKTIGGIWVSGLGVSMAYQWSRPIPTQLKIIHSRVYAQAFTLAALGLAAAADYYEHKSTTSSKLDEAHAKLRALEDKYGVLSPGEKDKVVKEVLGEGRS